MKITETCQCGTTFVVEGPADDVREALATLHEHHAKCRAPEWPKITPSPWWEAPAHPAQRWPVWCSTTTTNTTNDEQEVDA